MGVTAFGETSPKDTNEKIYQNLFNATTEGIAVHDKGVILDVNTSLKQLFGYSPEEKSALIGHNVIEFIAEESHELLREQIEFAAAHPTEESAPYEAIGIKNDGTKIFVEINSKPHTYLGRNVRLVSIWDITERKHIEEQLKLEKGVY